MKFTERLKIAGKEALHANFGKAYDTLSANSYRGPGNDFYLFGDGSSPDMHFTFTGAASAIKAYTTCPPLAAVINSKAQAYGNGKTWILNKESKEATTQDANRLRKLMAL